ncbi:unnamed protein product [Adineta ricciae]|nr:unnamed protein product [Adineta ricciae]
MTAYRNTERYDRIFLTGHRATLAFGALTSPIQFQCAESKFYHEMNQHSTWHVRFATKNSFIAINMGYTEFQLKREHIDTHRGVVYDVKSRSDVTIHIFLKNNLEEYIQQQPRMPLTTRGYTRRVYLQNTNHEKLHPSFSTLRLSIQKDECEHSSVDRCLRYMFQYCARHSIPFNERSIEFLHRTYIYQKHFVVRTESFIIQYAWHMLASIGCRVYEQMVNSSRMTKRIVKLVRQGNEQRFYYVMERLQRLATGPEGYFVDLFKALSDIEHEYKKLYLSSIYHEKDQSWKNYVRIPWFRFTPTRLIVKPLKFMKSNRVFRYIGNVKNCMAFVDFRDDNGSEFLCSELVPFLEFYLKHGFHFENRHYVYLHHAQSQIRKKQFYFYCEAEGGQTREQLEEWMGNFNEEKLPAKNTARRTQPFSSTEATIEIAQRMVEIIHDIKTKDEKYNFTDGVGQISSDLNLRIHEELGVNVDDGGYVSSVLQIRYGGCKGTLAVNPELDGQEKQLLIRKSMQKFQCNHIVLEVCKRSLRRRLCLNREVINLLSYRKISSERLLAFQLQNVRWLFESFISDQAALSVLEEKVLHVLPWRDISAYQGLFKEPFFGRLLRTTISNNLHQLVTRAHIRVPQARYMFGVVDEYAVLPQGKVFIQITHEDGTREVLQGPVAITKNPCHHPGDLLRLEAVDAEHLHHLYDVLVFPQLGSRPHASEMSGSDLDGDEFTVIWDPELIPNSPNPQPHNYDDNCPAKPLRRIVTRDDRLKVIRDVCEQDNLGRLSILHLVHVDKFGIDSDEAIKLAAGISHELDSVKSGHHPYTATEIKNIASVAGTSRPDFMQAKDCEQYQSEKALGKLFRSADRLAKVFQKLFTGEDDIIDLDLKLLHKDYEKYIDFAKNLYRRYRFEMFEIIRSYGFSNEIDLFCCMESRNVGANERSDVQYTAQELLKAVFADIRRRFLEDTRSPRELKAKASACYYVAYNDCSEEEERMLSFPWLFASQLLSDYSADSPEENISTVFNSNISHWWKSEAPRILKIFPKNEVFSCVKMLQVCLEKASTLHDEQLINYAEQLLEQIIITAKKLTQM